MSLAGSVTAVGSDIMSILDYAATFTVTLSDGSSYTTASSQYPARTFIGFTSTTPISSISFTASGGYAELDNFVFGHAAVPEPSTLAIASLGAFGFLICARRRMRNTLS